MHTESKKTLYKEWKREAKKLREEEEVIMAAEKIESVIAGSYLEMEREEESRSINNNDSSAKTKLSNFFWHGGSVYDAWFSCASNQVYIFIHHLPVLRFMKLKQLLH